MYQLLAKNCGLVSKGDEMLTRAGAAYERILARSVGTTGPIPGLESWLQEALLFIPCGQHVNSCACDSDCSCMLVSFGICG